MQRQADQEDQGLEAALTKQVKGAQKIGYWPGPKSVIPIYILFALVYVSPVDTTDCQIDPVIFSFNFFCKLPFYIRTNSV